ncbi:MAG: hypothetical protein LC731_06845 [Acidobacteria bacterium]|nr:hypothetical protein [Acidobacteriota bacterium]
MRDTEIRQSETIVRMRDFGVENALDFPAASLGGQKFASLNALVAEIDELGAQRSEGRGAAQMSTEAKRVAREGLRSLMRAISDTAEAMESAHPGISNTFRLPKTNADEALINDARAFVTSATPLKSEFLQYEMPATFIEDLTDAIEEFEEATGSRNLNTRKRVSATAALRDALERGMQIKRELDPIVRNKYRNNPAKLAAWESASRVERAPRKKAKKSAPPS